MEFKGRPDLPPDKQVVTCCPDVVEVSSILSCSRNSSITNQLLFTVSIYVLDTICILNRLIVCAHIHTQLMYFLWLSQVDLGPGDEFIVLACDGIWYELDLCYLYIL